MHVPIALRGRDEVPASSLGGPGEENLQEPDAPAVFARKLRVAETGIGEVDDYAWFLGGGGAFREFTSIKDFH